MCRLHSLVALVVVLALVGGVEAVAKGKKKNKKTNAELIHGKVEAVQRDAGGNTGTITIRVHHHHAKKKAAKAGGAAKAGKKKHHHDVVVKVLSSTEFFKAAQGGGQNKGVAASFKDIQKGEHVVVRLTGGKEHDAKSVTIEAARQKKATKKAAGQKKAAKKKGNN